jgi:hypothetical protein
MFAIVLAWVAISAAGVLALSALARATARNNAELDLASPNLDGELYAGGVYAFDADPRTLGWRR